MEALARPIKQEKEMKDIQIGHEEIKLSMLAGDVIVYICIYKTRKISHKNLLKLTHKFSKVAGY